MPKIFSVYKYGGYLKDVLFSDGVISFAEIGVFTLKKEFLLQEGVQSSAVQQIDFEYNKKADTSENLILFVAEKEKKNKQIIAMDFESYLNEMRQLLNTGKEFIIAGIGYLYINKQGVYVFAQQATDALKHEDSAKKQKKRNELYKESFVAKKKSSGIKSSNAISIIIFVLIIAAAGIFYWNYNKKESNTLQNNTAPVIKDSVNQINSLPIKKSTDTISVKNDSATYKFIFETTVDSSRAHLRAATLRSYGDAAFFDSIANDNGLLYRIYILKKILPVDSVSIKDSLHKYFGRNILIEKLVQ